MSAVRELIALISKVLLDDGNRIVNLQGIFVTFRKMLTHVSGFQEMICTPLDCLGMFLNICGHASLRTLSLRILPNPQGRLFSGGRHFGSPPKFPHPYFIIFKITLENYQAHFSL